MTKLNVRDTFALGFMTFALFIGAGNIIFPPIVAYQAGDHVWLAALGFLVTAVGLPVLSIIMLGRVQGSIETLGSSIGRFASVLLAVACYLSVGPLFGIPRTASVSYEIGLSSHFTDPQKPLLIYSIVYFVIVTLVSLNPNKLLDSIGHILAPIKILALAVLCGVTLFVPLLDIPPATHNYVQQPVAEGLVNGYLTLDTLSALVFGILIVQAIKSRGVTDSKLITKYAVIASIISGVGLTILYLCLFRLGVQSHSFLPTATNGAEILHAYVLNTLGQTGSWFLSLLIFLACIVTAIGLTCSCAEYFHKMTKIPYKILVLVFVLFSLAFANFGLTKLISISVPILTAIYPPAIVVILAGLFVQKLNRPKHVVLPVAALAFIIGIFEGLRSSELKGLVPDLINALPLAEQNLDWFIPSVILLIICVIIDRFKSS
ncbi:branched-chain amino acid transport system II carrier protein [Acinetobacter nectaris CIP 110549]|uniref:Branched-chain amino acid transport system carrier protein n=1 Tax=Acinetobacter nectaris CIP 110549 TaxID=1392540 RepID=V2TQX2_9GAMM|nr:branched-chain amino acid transport system II carrier protein [Acinetobacter nectaris]ESK39967.1 branched-chain amino acid transport system II carrier protein [Acinetobacter nectaris CIP 110549]